MKISLQMVMVDHEPCYALNVIGFDPSFPAKMKTVPRARWNPQHKSWVVPRTEQSLAALEGLFGKTAVQVQQSVETHDPPSPDELPGNPTNLAGITLQLHPSNPAYLCLYLPKSLTEQYLLTVKNIHGRKWNPELVCWEIPYTKLSLRFLEKYFPEMIQFNFKVDLQIPERLDPAEPTFQQSKKEPVTPPARYESAVTALEQTLMLKRYSWRTIKSYKNCFRQFIRHYDSIKPSQISRAQINDYLSYLIRERNVGASHQSQVMSAIKMFYTSVIDQEDKVKNLFQPRRPQKLPKVLTEEEVTALLRCVENLKHRCILMLIYSAGLRLGELINLRLHDLQPEKNRLWVRNGKGGKDRCTILSEKVWLLLKEYIGIYKPVEWVFEGQAGGPYSERSVQKLFTYAKMRSMINPLATVHTLRHSFATHLLEKGVNLRYIQELLGHESSKTTEIYTHITNRGWDKLKSPIDDLNL